MKQSTRIKEIFNKMRTVDANGNKLVLNPTKQFDLLVELQAQGLGDELASKYVNISNDLKHIDIDAAVGLAKHGVFTKIRKKVASEEIK